MRPNFNPRFDPLDPSRSPFTITFLDPQMCGYLKIAIIFSSLQGGTYPKINLVYQASYPEEADSVAFPHLATKKEFSKDSQLK